MTFAAISGLNRMARSITANLVLVLNSISIGVRAGVRVAKVDSFNSRTSRERAANKPKVACT